MVQELATANWWKLSPDASGSYVNGSWTQRTAGPNGPTYYASGVLKDGRVLFAGGEDNFGSNGVDLDAAEIYDPVTDAWTTISTPGWGWIGDAPGCALPDGRFIMGSINDTRTAIYDPVANKWTPGPDKSDASSEETWTLLRDGTVMTAEVGGHPKAEKYLPSTNSWVSAGSVPSTADLVLSTSASTEIGPAILMADGRVFATGASGHTALYTSGATPADPGTWAAGPDFPADAQGNPWRAFDAPAVLLPNGKVLCIAGPAEQSGWSGSPSHALEFDGKNLSPVSDPPNATNSSTWECRLLLLPTGEVLCSARNNNMQVYQPDGAPNPGWAPTIISAPASIPSQSTFTLEGTQLNGLSQANSYGDDAQMATNFPIVRIETGGNTYYCRTYGFSTLAVATGATIVSAQVDVPAGIPDGPAQLCVVANGIATCKPVMITGVLQLFYRGADNGVWSRWRNDGGSWSGEQSLGGKLISGTASGSSPAGTKFTAAVVPGTDVLQLFYRGTDNGVWSRWRNPDGSWSAEQRLGGVLTSDITAAVVPGTDVLQLFYRGTDNGVWSRWRNPDGSWSAEQRLGGVLTSDITAMPVP